MISSTEAAREHDTIRNIPFSEPRKVRCHFALHTMISDLPEKVLQLLASVAETDEVRSNLDLPLYDYQVLDSMKTVELIVAIEGEFGLEISPAEFERENWATPRKIVADIQHRLHL
jgi:D-alanine--poly(phosphoribitol) ligase subunit 2